MRLRTILFAILALVVLIVAGVVVVLLNTDFGRYKGLIAERVEQETGRKLTIGGDLKLTLLPAPALSVKDVAFANADWGSRPQMAKLGTLSAEVRLLPLIFGGNVSVSRLVLQDVDLLLETDAKGRQNWVFTTSAPPAAQAPTQASDKGGALILPSFDNISLKNIVVAYRDGTTGKTIGADLKELTALGAPGGPLKVTAAAAYQGLPIAVAATVGALSTLAHPGTPYPVQAELSAAGATIKLIGSAADPVRAHGLNITLAVDGKDLSSLSGLAGSALPAKPYHLAATLTGDADKSLALKGLQASFGASALTGEAGVALDGVRPKITANVTAPMLDLTELPQSKPAPPKPGKADRMFSDDPLPVEMLRVADADVTFAAATVKTEKLVLQNASAHLTLDDRALQVKPFGVDLAGSHIGGELDLSSRQAPAVFALTVNGKQVDIGKLLQQLTSNDLLEAKGDLDVGVRGTGDSLHAIMASLNGQSSMVVGKGRIKSRYADLIGADVFREAFAWAKGKQDTTLNCMVSRFDIKNGLATSRGILMDTSDVTILGEGTIDLGPERLDLVLKPRPKETTLLNLAVPIDIGGTLKQPSVTPDKGAVAKDVAVGVLSVVNPLVAVGQLVLDNSSSADKNPCLAALEQSKGGAASTKAAPKKEEGGVSGVVKGIGRSIDSLFK